MVPIDIELRPLRLAEILDRIFQLYRARFALFFGIASVSTIIDFVWSVINLAQMRWLPQTHFSPVTQQLISGGSVIAGWTFMFAAAAVCLAATNRALAAIYDGKPTTIVGAYAASRSSWVRCIWINVLAFFIAWGALMLVFIAAVTAIVLASKAHTLGQANGVTLVYGAAGLLVVAALPLGIWLTLRYVLAVPACEQEGLTSLQALKRSTFLTRDTRGRMFALLMIAGFAQGMLGMVFMSPALVIVAMNHGRTSPGVAIYMVTASAICNAFTKPIYAIGLTLFYLDARTRKEGYDLERMMERRMQPSSLTLADAGLPPL